MSKYTKWFDGAKFQPHHHGIYEVNHPICGVVFQFWGGTHWFSFAFTRELAEGYYFKSTISNTQTPKFRGLKYDKRIHADLTH